MDLAQAGPMILRADASIFRNEMLQR